MPNLNIVSEFIRRWQDDFKWGPDNSVQLKHNRTMTSRRGLSYAALTHYVSSVSVPL